MIHDLEQSVALVRQSYGSGLCRWHITHLCPDRPYDSELLRDAAELVSGCMLRVDWRDPWQLAAKKSRNVRVRVGVCVKPYAVPGISLASVPFDHNVSRRRWDVERLYFGRILLSSRFCVVFSAGMN